LSPDDLQDGSRHEDVRLTDFFFRLDGPVRDRTKVTCSTVDEARNEAVRYLGRYLANHPEFAAEGHWRVNVENSGGQSYLHVIVATVTPKNAVSLDD
jgi:hypothetical protein